jgi:hypothetical protein
MTNAKTELQKSGTGTKAVVKLMKMGGVAELAVFGKFERARLARSTDYVRVARFNSNGPIMVEVTAAGWKKAAEFDFAGRFGV